MILTNKIKNVLSENRELRLKLALELEVGEEAIKRAAERDSKIIHSYKSIEFIKKETGLPLNEILETEKATA